VVSFEITIAPTSATVEPGSSVEYTLFIQNTGNIADTYDLTLQGLQTTWYSFSQTSVSLDPGQTQNVTLTVSPPYASMILKDYSFTVTATSQEDASISDSASGVATVDFTPTLPDAPTGGLAIAVQPKTIYMSPGTQTVVNILVLNNQNFDDAVWINLTVSDIPEAYRADLAWFNWTAVKVFIPAEGSINNHWR
jgi:uncharacterized membrane protein